MREGKALAPFLQLGSGDAWAMTVISKLACPSQGSGEGKLTFAYNGPAASH